jgi:hypothetical protein
VVGLGRGLARVVGVDGLDCVCGGEGVDLGVDAVKIRSLSRLRLVWNKGALEYFAGITCPFVPDLGWEVASAMSRESIDQLRSTAARRWRFRVNSGFCHVP